MTFISDHYLKQLGTNHLVDCFRRAFLDTLDDPQMHKSTLDSIAEELAQRPIHQTLTFYHYLAWNFLKPAVREERYEAAATYRDMLLHYALRIL